MSEPEPSMEESVKENSKRDHAKILGLLFILFGCSHLLAVSFVWLILFALAHEGYGRDLAGLPTVALLAAMLFMVGLPLLSGISLLRASARTRLLVWLTCFVILCDTFLVLRYLFRTPFSSNRLVFALIYGVVNVAICAYGLWFVNRKAAG
jgi:hypothetical protein